MSLVIPQASISFATQVSTKKLNKRDVIVFIIGAKLEKKLTKLVSLVNLGLAISIFLKRISSPKHPYKKSLGANYYVITLMSLSQLPFALMVNLSHF
jgi:hypothetical protein